MSEPETVTDQDGREWHVSVEDRTALPTTIGNVEEGRVLVFQSGDERRIVDPYTGALPRFLDREALLRLLDQARSSS